MRGLVLVLTLFLAACGTPSTTNNYTEDDFYTIPGDGGIMKENSSPRDGWSASGELFTRDPNTSVRLQADFSKSKYGAGVYTVQFGVTPPNGQNGADAIATVNWRIGNTVTRKVTVGNGVSLTGVGQALDVSIADATLIGTAGLPYVVSMTVAPGAHASRNNPPTLRSLPTTSVSGSPYSADIIAGGTALFPIAPNSGAVSAYVAVTDTVGTNDVDPNKVTVSQVDDALNNYLEYYPLIDTGFIPLYPVATQLLIANDTANSITVTVLQGIDG